MISVHKPTTNDKSIISTRTNHRLLLELQQTSYLDYALDQFATAMEELAIAARKAKRASKWERRWSA